MIESYLPVIAIIIAALSTLGALTFIDLRTMLLPNKLVLTFALLGIAFQAVTKWMLIDPMEMALGVLVGGGILLTIRTVSNYLHQEDTLGLGDVKLLAAAGLWLGSYGVLLALIIGSIAGLLHGILLMAYAYFKTGEIPKLTDFSLPAGPGFIVGIIGAFIVTFKDVL